MMMDKENVCFNISPTKGPRDPTLLEKKRSFTKPTQKAAKAAATPAEDKSSTKTFVEWINFTFSQQNVIHIPDTDDNESVASMDTTMANEQSVADSAAAAQVLKARMQKRTDEIVREKARSIMRSILVSSAIRAIDNEVNDGGLQMRSDCDLHIDLYHQETMTNLLFCYEESWLALGLSTIFNEVIPSSSKGMKKKLQAFINDKFYSKNNRITQDKKLKQMNKTLLKKFLHLVVFLDAAREAAVLPKACLFQTNASYKSSKEVVSTFCRNFLQGAFFSALINSIYI